MEDLRIDDMELANVKKILEEFANEVIQQYKANLSKNGHNASGQLANNVEFIIDSAGTAISVKLNLADYYRYIEEGRGSTKSGGPGLVRERILDWIRVKGITPKPDKNGNLPSEKSLAFLIARKIHREGYKGTHDLHDAVQSAKDKYMPRLQQALEDDFGVYQIKILDRVNKMIKI